MLRNDLITVIITCYNRANYIAETLTSLKSQFYSNFEALIIDDGSTDNSREIITATIGDDKRFRLFASPHIGFPKAKNLGLDNAHGDYIIFLDSDDVVHPQWLSLLHYTAVITGAPVVICNFDTFSNDNLYTNVPVRRTALQEYSILKMAHLFHQTCMSFMWNKLVRADLYRGIRCPDQIALSDVGTMYRVFERASFVVHISNVLIHYRQHDQSMGNVTQAKGASYWNWRIDFQKHLSRYLYDHFPLCRQPFQLALRAEVALYKKAMNADPDVSEVRDILADKPLPLFEQ